MQGRDMATRKLGKRLKLTADTISWKGRECRIADITHLTYERVHTTYRRMGLGVMGEADYASIVLEFRQEKPMYISVDEAPTIYGFIRDRSEDIVTCVALYRYLAQATFRNRLQPHLDSLSNSGYFTYEKHRFIPRKMVAYKNKQYSLDEYLFVRYSDYILIRKKNHTWKDELLKQMFLKGVHLFLTLTDGDILFYLLDQHMDVTWGK